MKTAPVRVPVRVPVHFLEDNCSALPVELLDKTLGPLYRIVEKAGFSSLRAAVVAMNAWDDNLSKLLDIIAPEAMPYSIRRAADGERFVLIGRQLIPADIAGLCTGPDLWISQIECKCRGCGEKFPLRKLAGGGQWCEPCQTADMEE